MRKKWWAFGWVPSEQPTRVVSVIFLCLVPFVEYSGGRNVHAWFRERL